MTPVTTHPGKRQLFRVSAEGAQPPRCPQRTKAARRCVSVSSKPDAALCGSHEQACGNTSGRTARLCRRTGKKSFVGSWEGCGRSLAQASRLTGHKGCHPGGKPFVCPQAGCGYLYAHPSDLKRHWRVHSGEKPFVCPYEGCGNAFGQSGNLTIHLRVHSRERPFVCPREGCGYACAQSSNLKQHKRFHSRERPFVCPNKGCGRAFVVAVSLKRHRCLHARDTSFVCPYKGCRRSFLQSSHLAQHLCVHSGDPPFVFSQTGSTHLSEPGSGGHCMGRSRAEPSRCLEVSKGLPAQQQSRAGIATGACPGAVMDAELAADLDLQSTGLASGKPGLTKTALPEVQGVPRPNLMADEQQRLQWPAPSFPYQDEAAFAGLQLVALKDFDRFNLPTDFLDGSPCWPLFSLPETGAFVPDAAALCDTNDDQAFWQTLLAPADIQTR